MAQLNGCPEHRRLYSRNKTVGKVYTLLFARFLPVQPCFLGYKAHWSTRAGSGHVGKLYSFFENVNDVEGFVLINQQGMELE